MKERVTVPGIVKKRLGWKYKVEIPEGIFRGTYIYNVFLPLSTCICVIWEDNEVWVEKEDQFAKIRPILLEIEKDHPEIEFTVIYGN